METLGNLLPYIYASLMLVSVLMYVVLDGYDLGVGILSFFATEKQRNDMIASIGPFWDANGTWLVLGIGILFIAFPSAYEVVCRALYLPIFVMLIGIILRGISFEFRVKSKLRYRNLWNNMFFAGSLLTTLAQGFMLGSYVLGFQSTVSAWFFALFISVCFVATYSLVGASWLIMKTHGNLQKRAIFWARQSLWWTAINVAAISLVTPWLSERIYDRWFSMPNILWLSVIPLSTFVFFGLSHVTLRSLPRQNDAKCWVPFVSTVGIFILAALGLGYSFFPYVVPGKITILAAASATKSLMFLFIGTLFVFPVLLGYTFLVYKVFHGKSSDLRYD